MFSGRGTYDLISISTLVLLLLLLLLLLVVLFEFECYSSFVERLEALLVR